MSDHALDRPLLYVLMGTPGSGRRGAILDFVKSGLFAQGQTVVLMSRSDTDIPEARALNAEPGVSLIPWAWDDGAIRCEALTAGAGSAEDRIFLVCEPLRSPVDQMEALVTFIAEKDLVLARILLCVDCRFVSENEERVIRWLDACMHFADCALLGNRSEVSPKWVQGLESRYKKLHFPCLFFPEKKGGFSNPALILESLARRVSLAFDREDPEFEDDPDIEDEPDLIGKVDPYFERQVSGRREKQVPEIASFFSQP